MEQTMADRDVRLVIRAKNEATKAIDSVTDALKKLSGEQKKAGDSAKKADGLLGQLAQEFNALQTAAKGLTALGTASAQIDKVRTAVDNLNSGVKGTTRDFVKYSRDARQASRATFELSQEVAKTEARYRSLKFRADEARQAQMRGSEAAKAVTAAQRQLNQVLRSRSQGSARMSAEVFATEELNRSKAALADLTSDYKRLSNEARTVGNTLSGLRRRYREAGQEEERLTTQTKRLRASLAQQRKALNESKETLDKLDASARKAADGLGVLGQSEAQVAQQSAKMERQMERMRRTAEAARSFSTGDGNFADPRTAARLREQNQAVNQARENYRLLAAELARVRQSMRNVVSPTREQVEALRQAEAAARAARAEYDRQIQTLNRMPGAVAKMNGIRGFFGSFYGESRKAMSLLQRLRGEVLSLATAYLGLYSAIHQVEGVITAYQKVEAAQNRLGVVFDQNQSKMRAELEWLERQAARLGIEFGVLSDEYGKFAVAANAAGFEASSVRKIFLSVAEAGRVNKNSMEQMSGIFLALTQMISKGKVTSEELRRQLGDRMAGAFNIFADAIGVTTAELDEMMKRGEVLANETNLLKFADQLTERFGPQLGESLKSTTTLLGQFRNEIFQAQIRVGEGGFIAALNDLLAQMIEYFQSREGRDFFLSLGAALGQATNLLGFFIENFELFVTLVKVLIALKFARWVLSLAGSFSQNLLPALVSSVNQFRNVRTAAIAAGGGLTSAAAGARAFGAALKSLPGVLLITGITLVVEELVSSFIGGVDGMTRSLDEHKRIMQEVIGAYEGASQAAQDWQKNINNVTVAEAESNFLDRTKDYEDAIDGLKRKLTDLNLGQTINRLFSSTQVNKVRDLIEAFDPTDIDSFVETIDELNREITEVDAKKLLLDLRKLAVAARDASERQGEAAAAAKEMGSDLETLQEAVDRTGASIEDLAGSTEESGSAFSDAVGSIQEYEAALDKMREGIPRLAAELQKVKDLTELDANFAEAMRQIDALGLPPGARAQAYAQASTLRDERRQIILSEADRRVFREIAGNTKVSQELFGLIHGEESFRSRAYDDGYGTMTIGYGSTRIFGRAVQAGDTVTQEQAMQQAVSDMARIVAQIEAMVKVPLSDNQLNALVSYAYNAGIGSLARDGILQPLNRGDYAGAERAIRTGVDTSKGVFSQGLRNRREREADLFASGLDSPEVLAEKVRMRERAAEEAQREAEAQERLNQATEQTISDKEFEIQQAQLISEGRGREAAIEAAIREAKQQNANITEEQLQRIREVTGALYDQQHATDAVKEAEERVNQLYQLRRELMEQLQFHQDQGNDEAVANLTGQINELDVQLKQAIADATTLMQKLGGEGADLAIAKMQNLGNSIQSVGQKSFISGEQMNNMLASGLVNMFDRFAQAVANGEDAVDALWTAFRQFAADFLLQIARMIIQQALLNALQGFSGGFAGFLGGLFHEGGTVGATVTGGRMVSPSWFTNAVRYHEGGIAGLKPGEVPSILEVGEEVLTKDDPRHVANGGMGGSGQSTKVINMFDVSSFLSEALSTKAGEKAILNFVRANPAAFKSALNG